MTITQSELETHLWDSANYLRGRIDAGDYKQYIFPLIFFKRISDVFDEEYNKALVESNGDKEYAKIIEYQFKIPSGSHWNDVRKLTKNIGNALHSAFRVIEKSNPPLFGIFGDAQWSNKSRLPDRVLLDLIEHFSSVNFGLENIAQDKLGEAYEYLIKQFADDSGHTAAEFYTNRTLVKLMTEILNPTSGDTVYDPTCGSGGMLLVTALHLAEKGKEYRNLKLYGQEINLITSAIAKMNLYLHGIDDFSIIRGDTLANPAFIEGDELQRFDVILANPPYSIKKWDQKAWSKDKWGRNIWGLPPQGRADYAFFQHIIASLDDKKGRCAILFPHGVLFRDDEKHMREKLIKSDVIECILGLGPNLFYNSTMDACVIFCRKNKPLNRQNKILFINAINEIRNEKIISYLDQIHIEKIANAFKNDQDILNFSKFINLETIKGNEFDLSITKYITSNSIDDLKTIDNKYTLPKVIHNWREKQLESNKQISNMINMLKEVGIVE